MTTLRSQHGKRAKLAKPTPVDLALQGGGSHGAFAWRVLDALRGFWGDVAGCGGAFAIAAPVDWPATTSTPTRGSAG